VDFLLRRQREFIAIEVKASKRFERSMLQGLRAIAALPGVVRRVLVYAGERSLRVDDGIEIWPIRRLSETLALGRLWP
jgi:predicted AAA+ superfamily ATPase